MLTMLLTFATFGTILQGRPAGARQAPAPSTVAGKLGSQIDSVVRAAQSAGFAGVVRVEKAGTLALDKGYGFANRASGIPFSAQTVVQVGSNTKDFTAVALLQLHEQGKLNIHDSLGHYFMGVPPDKQGI